MPRGVSELIPCHRQLRHWEQVCAYLDSQPFRAVRYPFPSEPPMSSRLLRRMARFKLIRHCHTDCSYRLSQRCRAILRRLWDD